MASSTRAFRHSCGAEPGLARGGDVPEVLIRQLPRWHAEAVHVERAAPPPSDGLRLVNVDLARARAFIHLHHSHLPELNPRGLLYAVGVMKGARLVAVATAGTPTGRWSRRIDPHRVLELTRVASDGTVQGAASKLVGRMIDLLPRSGRNGQPGELFVTYSLVGEPGTPYKALAEKGLRPVAIGAEA